MTPTANLQREYTARLMYLGLSPGMHRGWEFRFVEPVEGGGGLSVVARMADTLEPLPTFKTRRLARTWADGQDMPAYAIWNGRTKRYEGLAHEVLVKPREA